MTVYAEDFGAIGDGVTDDTAAIQTALNSLGVGGGEVVLRNRYLLDTQLTVPENCRLLGTFSPFGILPWQNSQQAHSLASTLIVNKDFSITLSAGSQLENLSVIRKGTTKGEPDTSLFKGTAIVGHGVDGNEMDGIGLRNLQILGFDTAIDLDYAPRSVIDYVSGDNKNGIRYGTIYDVIRISNVHMWPFHTIGAGMEGAAHNRGGIALYLGARNDIAEITNVFSYGYLRGINLGDSIGTATFVNCHADNTRMNPNSIGFVLEGGAAHTTFIGCSSYSNNHGFWCTPLATDNIHFTNCRAVDNSGYGWRVETGTVRLTACEVSGSSPTAAAYGVSVNASGSIATVEGCSFSGLNTNNLLASAGGKIYEHNNKFDNAAPNRGWLVDQIPSTDPLVLPMNGDVFTVTGTTGFGNLYNDWAGREVTLIFQSSLTVYDGSSMHLNGDFVATPDDVLKLVHNGTYWCEVSRSAN